MRQAQAVAVADLAEVTHDPLLASLRQRLRKAHGAPRQGRLDIACVFSREAVAAPVDDCDIAGDTGSSGRSESDGSLNCHGYGSTVTVTASFGMVAAGLAIDQLLAGAAAAHKETPGRPKFP